MSVRSIFLLLALATVAIAGPRSEEAALDLGTCTSGKRKGNACCASSCAVCGGGDCGATNMGPKCCISQIRAANLNCATNPAPCVIPIKPTPSNTPSMPPPPPSDSTCATGILNRKGTVCCAASCGACGGKGCGKLPGGARNCCKGRIDSTQGTCDTQLPPCMMSVAMPPTPSATATITPTASKTSAPTPSPSPSDATDPDCNQGILNPNGKVCCAASCLSCGGDNCSSRPGGAQNCCNGKIMNANKPCSANLPPCVV